MAPSSLKCFPPEDQGVQREETGVSRAQELIVTTAGVSAHTESSTAEIEASKGHWTELGSLDDQESLAERNLNVFRSLQQEYGRFDFFEEWDDNKMRLGRKVAEGGQAEIFEIEEDLHGDSPFLLKVFKEGASLQDLRKQWPLDGMFAILGIQAPKRELYMPHYSGAMYGGVLLKNGRFAFKMRKYWGDLRKLIDLKMSLNTITTEARLLQKRCLRGAFLTLQMGCKDYTRVGLHIET
jgi:hypothetical protein